jgi:predicted DNA-binding protein (UPF0251 family)
MGRPDRALEVQEIYATIAELPEDFRLALVAVDVLGLSYREAARALRVREATLTTRLFRARKQVTRRLASDDAGSVISASGKGEGSAQTRPSPLQAIRREDKGPGGVFPSEGTP